MGKLENIILDKSAISTELNAFKAILAASDIIGESALLKHFRANRQLSASFGSFVPKIRRDRLLAYEYDVAGVFAADIVVGDKERGHYCMIEFEAANPYAMFKNIARKTPEWGAPFLHAFGQVIDWNTRLDDLKQTSAFRDEFGHKEISFTYLIVAGRSANLGDKEQRRLQWFSDKVVLNSQHVTCMTYDEMVEELEVILET